METITGYGGSIAIEKKIIYTYKYLKNIIVLQK